MLLCDEGGHDIPLADGTGTIGPRAASAAAPRRRPVPQASSQPCAAAPRRRPPPAADKKKTAVPRRRPVPQASSQPCAAPPRRRPPPATDKKKNRAPAQQPGRGFLFCGFLFCGFLFCGLLFCGFLFCGFLFCGFLFCGLLSSPSFFALISLLSVFVLRSVCGSIHLPGIPIVSIYNDQNKGKKYIYFFELLSFTFTNNQQ